MFRARQVIRLKDGEQAAAVALILAKNGYTARIEQGEDNGIPEGCYDIIFWENEEN